MSEPVAPTRRDWLTIVLMVSLVANGLLLGFAVGHRLNLLGGARQNAGSPQIQNFGARLSRLPAAERQHFQAAMKPARAEIAAARAQVAEAQRQVAETLAHEPYDAEAMIQALADLRAKMDVVQARQQEAAARALAALSPQSREVLAEP